MTQPDDARPNKQPSRTPGRAVRSPSWAAGDHPDAVDGPFVVERLTALTHDLANLLDGSMRCLGLARRALGRELAVVGVDEIEESRRQVDTVYGALVNLDAADLSDLLGVSRVTLDRSAPEPRVNDLRGEPRCERSWKRDGTVKRRSDGGMLSDRDAEAVGVR